MGEARFSRRRALAGAGSVSLGALLAACGGEDSPSSATTDVATGDEGTATVRSRAGRDLAELFDDDSSCTLTAEETEGPYYFDVDRIRSDITEGRPGVPLRLAIRVRDEGCEPIRNAVAEIWHCDAGGVYSGFEAGAGETFLRGAQVTNRDGIVAFATIYPGWYPGRTPHIHAKVHVDNTTVLTTQIYFDDAISSSVYAGDSPYQAEEGRVDNETDGIFDPALVLALSREGDGYLGTISFDVTTA